MDLVSIIMPAYNSANFISDSIRSIQEQTYTNWELLITDDCSTDNTFEIVSKFSETDKRIKYFLLSINKGAAIARNNSLSHATGKYIAFLDSDDMWYPDKLMIQIEFMKSKKIPISFTSYEIVHENKNATHRVIKSIPEIDYDGYLKNTIIGMSTSMINKDIVGEFNFHNFRTRQDTYLWITLLKRGFKAYGIDDILAKYRIRTNSISSNKFKAAKRVWYLYYNVEKLGLIKSINYFSHYTLNALKKRVLK